MALVVFLRGVNVGGHRTFRPSVLAKELSEYDVVNVGAAGTFVVRKPGARAKFRAELRRRLPFVADVERFHANLSPAPPASFHSVLISTWRGMVRASHCVERAICVRDVSAAHENDWVSWAAR